MSDAPTNDANEIRPAAQARVLTPDEVAELWESALAPALRERAEAGALPGDLTPDAAAQHVGRSLLEDQAFLVGTRLGDRAGRLDVCAPRPPHGVEVLKLWQSPDLDDDDARAIGEAAAVAIRAETLRRLARSPRRSPLRRALRGLRRRISGRTAALLLALGLVALAELVGAGQRCAAAAPCADVADD